MPESEPEDIRNRYRAAFRAYAAAVMNLESVPASKLAEAEIAAERARIEFENASAEMREMRLQTDVEG
jgi:hypothetical protein